MVGGFGRFIRDDETSRNMSDLQAYLCRISVDDVREIPHRLSIVLGEELVDIHVHLESSECIRAGGADQPSLPDPMGLNDGARGSELQGGRREEGGGNVGEEGDVMEDGAKETALDQSSEISVNRSSTLVAMGVASRGNPAAAGWCSALVLRRSRLERGGSEGSFVGG